MIQTAVQEVVPFETWVAPGIVRRTDRGLCVAGTRITLYLIMDYLKAGRTPEHISQWLLLTEDQVNDVLRFIQENRESFEAEYAEVIRKCEERERYWRERNRQHQLQLQSQNIERNVSSSLAAARERLLALKREGKF